LKGNPCGCPNEAARVAPTGKREKRWVTVKITPKKVTPARVAPDEKIFLFLKNIFNFGFRFNSKSKKMKRYNPKIHNRRSIRLKGYDYSKAGLYFITICCQDRICRFGEVKNGEMILNEFGLIAYNEWIKLADRFMNFELDVFQIMPNHIHGIISLLPVGSGLAPDPKLNIEGQPQGLPQPEPQRKNPSIPDIVGAYKSLVANGCLEIYKSRDEVMGKFWQRNYYEHIIRNELAYYNISEYIINNPIKWEEDRFYMK
jgi:REP element-mobilizing transposase RayT